MVGESLEYSLEKSCHRFIVAFIRILTIVRHQNIIGFVIEFVIDNII